eukprot:evm.model.scf_457.4 EVM.evm.TU.scf_457.4   scf_457:58791-66895(-)
MFAKVATWALCEALLWALAVGHVRLAYPPSISSMDFLDNARTVGLCGGEASGADGSGYWRLPAVNNATTTALPAGRGVEVTWDLHYPHQGGWAFELFDAQGTLVSMWSDTTHWDCDSDGTQQSATLTMPKAPCKGCLLRLQRQALEWGDGYLFRSCALVDVVDLGKGHKAACGDCSGHGECVQGKCECDSSPEKGFWYGAHCERQNECNAHSDCGDGGKCIDTGALTDPQKQCYCKEGWFGDEEQPWASLGSSLPTRKCSRQSDLQLGKPADWGDEYPFKKVSPGNGAFTVFYKVDGEEIEFAIHANTTDWVAVGLRASSIKGQPARVAPVAGGATAQSEPTANGRRLLGPEGQMPLLQDEALETGAVRQLAQADEPAGTVDTIEQMNSAKKGAKNGKKQAAATQAALVDAEADYVSQAGCDVGFPVLAASDKGTHFGNAPKKGKNKRGLLNAVPTLGHEEKFIAPERALLQADSQAFSEPSPAESDGSQAGKTDAALFAEGTNCENILMDDPAAHAMINQDIIIGSVHGRAFRVQDSFTPSRSRPLPDVYFGGKDDIVDAVGAEADGFVDIKFRRKLSTTDQAGDYCILDNMNYLMIYAYGQEQDNYFHDPRSSLETGRASNKEFYGKNELKYHGGGIGSQHEGRGVLGTVDFFEDVEKAGECMPSSMDGYDCMAQVIPDSFTLHWRANAEKVDIAAEALGTGWVAVAWAESPGQMVGATAVLGWTSADGGGEVGVFKLSTKDPSGVVRADSDVEVSSAEIEEADNRTVLKFSRSFDASFPADANHAILAAFHATSKSLEYHGLSNRAPATVNFLAIPGADLSEAAPEQAAATAGASQSTSAVSLLTNSTTESSLQCVSSALEGYEDGCVQDTGIGLHIHWKVVDGKLHIAAEAQGTGWVSVAWTTAPGSMVGSTAVIGWAGSEQQIGMYKLSSKDVSGINPEYGAFQLVAEDTYVEETSDSRTILHFSRQIDPDFNLDANQDMVVAYHPSADGIEYHGSSTKAALTINFGSGSALLPSASNNVKLYWKVHGWLMVASWGLLIPIGAIIARTMKDKDPAWFYLHAFVQFSGLCVAIVGFVIAVLRFDPVPDFRHQEVGWVVMIMGASQPLLALRRPRKGGSLRMYWEWVHWTVGRGAILLAAWNIFMGIDRYVILAGLTSQKYHVMYGVAIGALALVYLALESRAEHIRRTRYTKCIIDRIDVLEWEVGGRRSPGKLQVGESRMKLTATYS